MWKIITSFNLNPLLKLFFYSPILSNNNPLLKIYCKYIVVTFLNCNFLFFILFFPSYHLDTFLLIFFFLFFFFLLVFSPPPMYPTLFLYLPSFSFSSSSFQIISSSLSLSLSLSLLFLFLLLFSFLFSSLHTHTASRHGLRLSFFKKKIFILF